MSSKISQLDSAGALLGGELLPMVQDAGNVKATVDLVADYIANGLPAPVLPGQGYALYLAAELEPDAIEGIQSGASFNYVVAADETKLVTASFATRLGATGRMETRNPQRPTFLRGTTLTGLIAGSTAVTLDPSLPVYSDAWETYYTRMQKIRESQTRNIDLTGASDKVPLLPGAYGAILTQITCFNLTWIIFRPYGTLGLNLWDEINDADPQRVGNTLNLAVSKNIAGMAESSSASTATGGPAEGTISFILCDAEWSEVEDSLTTSYLFRDDFMTDDKFPSEYTVSSNIAGNLQIDDTYRWLKLSGSSTWGQNGMFHNTSHTRVENLSVVGDIFNQQPGNTGSGGVGFADGTGVDVADFSHFITLGGTNTIFIVENGSAVLTINSAVTVNAIYRFKIVAKADGTARYFIQGGPEYPTIGGATWDDISPVTPGVVPNNDLYPAMSAFAGTAFVSDLRVFIDA